MFVVKVEKQFPGKVAHIVAGRFASEAEAKAAVPALVAQHKGQGAVVVPA